MRRMHTKEEIFDFVKESPTAAELAEDLANIVAFDRNEIRPNGKVQVQMIGGDRGIKKEDIPANGGVYRTSADGVFIKTFTGQYSYKVLAIYNNNIYIQSRDNTTETDFLFVAANLFHKPLYFHPVIAVSSVLGDGISLIIINNDPSPLDTWEKVKAYMLSIAASIQDTARFPVSGAFRLSNAQITARNIDARTDGIIRIYGIDGSGTNQSKDLENQSFPSVYDGVNRIS